MTAARISIKGQVQGLGFRPFVYRLARRFRLAGTVTNSRTGVEILVEGNNTPAFVKALRTAPPRLARITSIKVTRTPAAGRSGFSIIASQTGHQPPATSVDVLPDLTCCPQCRDEIKAPENRRHDYPFTNCTQCGPRYSIIQTIPYDRPRTTMKNFRMCPQCQAEYDNPLDRRFHAQPNCCSSCGPRLKLLHANGEVFDETNPLTTAARLLMDGKILAIKSLGGFHLACNALDETAVRELRKRKLRPDKPLAVMCEDYARAARFCAIDPLSRRLLQAEASPIVLLPRAKKPAAGWEIAPSVAPGINHLGVMLAYAPLHHLLFQPPATSHQPPPPPPATSHQLKVLVMTSANPKDEPVLSELPDLVARLGSVVDYILTNDRPIANRSDDSVVYPAPTTGHQPPATSHQPPAIILRRSRGYAPSPILLDPRRYRLKPILACGAELKNTFAIAAGRKIYLSPHIGDMTHASALSHFQQTLDAYKRWFDIRPRAIACDLHPDLISTRYAENLALKSHRPLVRVQHHHAHIASVIAEHNLPEPVLGIALDGTGLGADGKIWGCELLLVRRAKYQRLGHLRYLPLVGGHTAIPQPARIAAAYLAYLFGPNALARAPALAGMPRPPTPDPHLTPIIFTSSAGRLFDAVSAITGICLTATYDGQAPALLESAAVPRDKSSYFAPDQLRRDSGGALIIDPAPWLGSVLDDLAAGITPARISRRFHTTFIQAIATAAKQLARACGAKLVCLSGGTCQNRLLLTELFPALITAGLKPHTNNLVPVNDGGIAFGQVIVADAQLNTKKTLD